MNQLPPPKILKPIVIKSQYPLIKDHITKQNLTQKVTLKCKSPRPGSAFSGAASLINTDSQEQFQTSHPLQVLYSTQMLHYYITFNRI